MSEEQPARALSVAEKESLRSLVRVRSKARRRRVSLFFGRMIPSMLLAEFVFALLQIGIGDQIEPIRLRDAISFTLCGGLFGYVHRAGLEYQRRSGLMPAPPAENK